MNWKVLTVCVLAIAGIAQAADSVQPATATFSCKRGESVAVVSSGTIYRGTTLAFTNCVLYSDTSGVVTQGLSGVTVKVSVGNLTTNIDYSATVTSAANGTWASLVQVPDLSSWQVQVKITDGSTNSFIYPPKAFSSDQSMF